MTYPATPGYVARDTSKAAADEIEPHVSKIAGEVLAYIENCNGRTNPLCRGATCYEIECGLNLSHQTASARVRELFLKSLVRDSEMRRPTASGRKAIVWEPVK